MTEDEKKLIQARHRLEAVQARNRQKERKARTRRLIQEGAILESVWPEMFKSLETKYLKKFKRLWPNIKRCQIDKYKSNNNICNNM